MNGAHNCSDQHHLLSIWRAHRSEQCPVWTAACSLPIVRCSTVRMHSRWQVKEVSKHTRHGGLSEGIPHVLAMLCSSELKARRQASFMLSRYFCYSIFSTICPTVSKTFLPKHIFGKKFSPVLLTAWNHGNANPRVKLVQLLLFRLVSIQAYTLLWLTYVRGSYILDFHCCL